MASPQKPLIIGLTGGIATGKSTVSALLRSKGYPVVDADAISREITRRGSKAYPKIVKLFGKGVLRADRELDRAKIASLVFQNPSLRKKLEGVIHPLVRLETAKLTRNFFKRGKKTVFWDVPLLFEAGIDKRCDLTLCVTAPRKTQIERLKRRDGMTRAQALARIKSQMDLREKERRADFTIRNAGTKAELRRNLDKFFI